MPGLSGLPRLIVAMAFAAGVPSSAFAQDDANHRCWAPSPPYSERTDWYDAEGQFIQDTSTRSTASLVRRFAGTYRLLVVTTEGGLEKEVVEYNLKLAPPTRSQEVKIRNIPAAASGRLLVPLVGVLKYRRGAVGRRTMTDVPRDDLAGEVNFEYWPASGKIGFNVGLALDSGTLFQVTNVNQSGPFSGRWEDGGYTVLQLDTPIEPLLEHVRGYFCALASSSAKK